VRLALAVPTGVADSMATDAARYGHEVVTRAANARELVASLSRTMPEAAIVSAASQFLTETVLAECDSRGIRLLAAIGSDIERRRAGALGLFELLDADSEWPVWERLLLGSGPSAPARSTTEGSVIAVWGPAGSPGRTTVAIGVAIELALAGYSVALADVDTHGAAIAPALGMLDESPGFAAACRLAGADSLTIAELERIGQVYSTGGAGFWVLTGIGRASRWPELSGDRVEAAIAACRSWVDFTVLDTGSSLENDEEISSDLFAPRRNAATLTALASADHTIAVGAADPVGLSRFLRAHVDLVDTVQTDAITVVMNKIRASAIGVNPSGQVLQTLSRFGGIESPVLIPHDLPALDAAVLTGRTLPEVAPKSPARVAIRELVRTRILHEVPTSLATRVVRGRAHQAAR